MGTAGQSEQSPKQVVDGGASNDMFFHTSNTNPAAPSSPSVLVKRGNVEQSSAFGALTARFSNKGVSERIDADLQQATKKVVVANDRTTSSSDLVPLSHDFDLMRKELRTVIQAAKQYQASLLSLDAARTEMVTRLAKLSEQSPIDGLLGGSDTSTTRTTFESESYVSLTQSASAEMNDRTLSYQEQIVNYCTDWEQAVTSRVDQGTAETKKLRERLSHYENKVEALRKQVKSLELNAKKKGVVPDKLRTKLERNETKLDQAWKAYESVATRLGNLLERATQRGWCDLAPLVLRSMQWECERASGERDRGAQLAAVGESIRAALVDHESVQETVGDEESSVISVVEEADWGSETSGSISIATEEEPHDFYVIIDEESSLQIAPKIIVEEDIKEPKGASIVEEEVSRQVAVGINENEQELEQSSEHASTLTCQQFPACFCEGLHKLVFPHRQASALGELQGEKDLSSSKSPDQNVSGFGVKIEV